MWEVTLEKPGRVGYNVSATGEVPEWLNGAVSKTVVVLRATVGSNPTLSADCFAWPGISPGYFFC